MASIEDMVRELIAAINTTGEGRLQSINAKEKFTEARSRVTGAMGSIVPEPLQTAVDALTGAHDMANQAQAMADQATAAIERYITAVQR